MAYSRIPPPSVEQMLDDFADWMARHAQAKVTVRLDYRDGAHQTTEIDHRGPMPKKVKPNVQIESTPLAAVGSNAGFGSDAGKGG